MEVKFGEKDHEGRDLDTLLTPQRNQSKIGGNHFQGFQGLLTI